MLKHHLKVELSSVSMQKNTLRATHKLPAHSKHNWTRCYIDNGDQSSDAKAKSNRLARRKVKQAIAIMQEDDHLDETVSVYQEGRNAFLAGYGYIANP